MNSQIDILIKNLKEISRIMCNACGTQKGIFLCGGPCNDTRYCSNQCATSNWSDHNCFISGKGDKRERSEKEEETDRQNKRALEDRQLTELINSVETLLNVLGQNNEFLRTLARQITIEDIRRYNLVSRSFNKIVVRNEKFWYFVLLEKFPARLMIINYQFGKKASINVYNQNVKYSDFGLELLQPSIERQKVYYDIDFPVYVGIERQKVYYDIDFQVYVEELDGYFGTIVEPEVFTKQGIEKAYDTALSDNYPYLSENQQKIISYLTRWEFDRENMEWEDNYDDFFIDFPIENVPWNVDRVFLRAAFEEREESEEEESDSEN